MAKMQLEHVIFVVVIRVSLFVEHNNRDSFSSMHDDAAVVEDVTVLSVVTLLLLPSRNSMGMKYCSPNIVP